LGSHSVIRRRRLNVRFARNRARTTVDCGRAPVRLLSGNFLLFVTVKLSQLSSGSAPQNLLPHFYWGPLWPQIARVRRDGACHGVPERCGHSPRCGQFALAGVDAPRKPMRRAAPTSEIFFIGSCYCKKQFQVFFHLCKDPP